MEFVVEKKICASKIYFITTTGVYLTSSLPPFKEEVKIISRNVANVFTLHACI